MTGDFNHYSGEAKIKIEKLGYTEVFPDSPTFRRSGKQLDRMFTNCILKEKNLHIVNYSDHHQMDVTLEIPKNRKGNQGLGN